MLNLNKSMITGRLTADPELKTTASSIPVTSFTVAVNGGKSKDGSTNIVDYIEVVAWRATAEFVCKYFTKGQAIYVEGAIKTRTYKDKDENTRKKTEILAEKVSFVESKKDGSLNNETTNEIQGEFKEVADDDDLPF